MSLLRDILLATYLIALFLVGIEFGLRQADVNFDGSFYHVDREAGYVLRPLAEGWNVKEHEVFVKINSQGLRDREHTFERPPNVIRIAVVGDSVSEAKQVDLENAYWHVMEQALNRKLAGTHQTVEVLNFGVAGYGLAQDYEVIKDRVWQYDPQIVLLSGTLRSFILNSVRQLAIGTDQGPVPFFVMHDGKLELDDLTQKQRASFVASNHLHDEFGGLINSLRTVALVNAAARKLSSQVIALRQEVRGETNSHAKDANSEGYMETMPLLGPATPQLSQAWSVAEQLIRLCHSETVSHHAEFWLFTLDEPAQVDPVASNRLAFQRKLGISDLFLSDKLLAEFADREGILHGDLAPRMLAFAEKSSTDLHGFPGTPKNTGHWNEIGHRVAGEYMASDVFEGSEVMNRNHFAKLSLKDGI